MPVLYQFPTLLNAIIFILLLLFALEAGYQLGKRRSGNASPGDSENRNLVLTAMYALLGLMLAFTYTFTLSRADLRKDALINESNAIGSAFLKSGMIDEPNRSELRKALLDYAGTRVIHSDTAGNYAKIKDLLEQSSQAQSRIWPIVQKVLDEEPPGSAEVSIVNAVNDLFDAGSKRLAVSFDVLPAILLLMLLFLTCSCLALTGFNSGHSGKINRGGLVLLVFFLAVVILIITDFDRSFRGFVQISQQSMIDIIDDMERMLQSGSPGI